MRAATPAMVQALNETQTLASGLVIRQDVPAAVRPVFSQTEFKEFLYSTLRSVVHCFSLFRGETYGLTCRHAFRDFAIDRCSLRRRNSQQGRQSGSHQRHLLFVRSCRWRGCTDIEDVGVIEFANDISVPQLPLKQHTTITASRDSTALNIIAPY